jgi:Plasmid stability protein
MPIASVVTNGSTAGNVSPMATLTIRNLDDAVRDRLRQRAAEHGHSMEEEVRQILRQVVKPADTSSHLRGAGLPHSQPLRPARGRRIGIAFKERHPCSA